MIDDRMQTQPWGIAGGGAGAGTRYVLNPDTDGEQVFERKIDALPVEPGTRLLAVTPGGGGWGDPLERNPQAVAEDVALGLVSSRGAETDYGVALAEDGQADAKATEALRRKLREKRDGLPLFDRGQRVNDLVAADRITLSVPDG